MRALFSSRFFTFFATLIAAHAPSSFALNNACFLRVLDYQYQAPLKKGLDLAVIDVGSANVKLFIKKGSTGEVIKKSFYVQLGESLGKTGTIDAEAYGKLKNALIEAKAILNQHGMTASQLEIAATASLRDATNGKEIAKQLARDGFKVKILSEQEEGDLVFRAVIRGQKLPPQGAVVVEIGGGSTEIVFGKGVNEIDHAKSKVISAGSGSLALKDPFSITEVNRAARDTRKMLRSKSSPFLGKVEQAPLLGKGSTMKALRDIHLKLTGENIYKKGITAKLLDDYLSVEGLEKLKAAAFNPVNAEVKDRISQLPSKLTILREVKRHYSLPAYTFGGSGGMKEALARELEAKMIGKKIDQTTAKMLKQWNDSESGIIEKVNQVFDPEEFGDWQFRVKSIGSLEHKITGKWIKASTTIEQVASTTQISDFIGDGVGGRLTLGKAGFKDLDIFYSRLLKAVKNKDVKILEIHNYRGPNGIPYFTQAQVERLSDELSANAGYRIPLDPPGLSQKNSGYTALHFNLIDEKGVPIELQVRGKEVSRLAEFEHDLYDIRQGKADKTVNPKLVQTVKNLNEPEQQALDKYVRDCYLYQRQREVGRVGKLPELPRVLAKHPELSLESALH